MTGKIPCHFTIGICKMAAMCHSHACFASMHGEKVFFSPKNTSMPFVLSVCYFTLYYTSVLGLLLYLLFDPSTFSLCSPQLCSLVLSGNCSSTHPLSLFVLSVCYFTLYYTTVLGLLLYLLFDSSTFSLCSPQLCSLVLSGNCSSTPPPSLFVLSICYFTLYYTTVLGLLLYLLFDSSTFFLCSPQLCSLVLSGNCSLY